MVTLDDKLLGEKLHNYCSSSSEDEEEKDNDSDSGKRGKSSTKFVPATEIDTPSSSSGVTDRTGPKGVIKDWQRFKQMETEKRDEQDKEKRVLIKKLTMTCRSYLDDEEAKKQELNEEEFLDPDDEFFKEYRARLMRQMQERLFNAPRFGEQIDLTRTSFTEAIDNEKNNVTVIVHVYEQSAAGCQPMDECIRALAEQYPYVKFCRIQASDARLSHNFIKNGCPALLIYRGGELLSSFISITEKLGDDFVASDVENLLQEAGCLASTEYVKPTTVRDSQMPDNHSSDSDDE